MVHFEVECTEPNLTKYYFYDIFCFMVGPNSWSFEHEANATGLIPASIAFDPNTARGYDFMFTELAKQRDMSQAFRLLDGLHTTMEVNGEIFNDCQALWVMGDCALIQYGQAIPSSRLRILVIRQDIIERVRAIQLLPGDDLAASVNADDVIRKFRSADDVLQATRSIVDNV